MQDEDNLNLKEELRAKVKSDLSRLELTCHDMASVLHGLGIQVNGGANEVSYHILRLALFCRRNNKYTKDNER